MSFSRKATHIGARPEEGRRRFLGGSPLPKIDKYS